MTIGVSSRGVGAVAIEYTCSCCKKKVLGIYSNPDLFGRDDIHLCFDCWEYFLEDPEILYSI